MFNPFLQNITDIQNITKESDLSCKLYDNIPREGWLVFNLFFYFFMCSFLYWAEIQPLGKSQLKCQTQPTNARGHTDITNRDQPVNK